MPSEWELAEIEKIAAFIYIIASAAIIESSIKTQKEEVNKKKGISSINTEGLTPSQLVVLSEIIFLVGSLMFEKTAKIRLKQVQMNNTSKENNISVLSNKYLTLSEVFFVIGGIIGVAGAQLGEQESNVTIV